MNRKLKVLLASLLLVLAAPAGFAQEKQVASAKEPVAATTEETASTKEEKSDEAVASKPVANKPAPSTAECRFCRWFEPTTASFSLRYRSITDSNDVHAISQNQQRIILGGKLKFDREGRYTINAQASSGYYFNWAYADTGWGATVNESIHEKMVPKMIPVVASRAIPGILQGAVSNTIHQMYPNATPAQVAQFTPVFTEQLRPIVTQQVTDVVTQTLDGVNTRTKGWNLFIRQLYFQAKPVNGLELQYGSLGINKGVNSEATSFDDDGYVMGGRVSVKRPDKFFFDEMSATYAYFGDIFTPNFFRRTERAKESNYHQFLLRKKFGNRVDASADYTFLEGTDTMREGVKINTKELKVVDSVLFEAYQRIGDRQLPSRMFKAGNGFAIQGEKTLAKRFTLTGGYTDIDPDYTVYTESVFPGIHIFGFSLNGDQTGIGRRIVGKVNYKLTDDFSVSAFYARSVNNDPAATGYYWNKNAFNVAVTYDLLKGLKRFGLLK